MIDRDTISKLAIEAGLYSYCEEKDDAIERFAALVAEHVSTGRPDGCRSAIARARQEEREACAAHYLDICRKAIVEEREACASICDRYDHKHDIPEVRWCAQDIRARSNP